MGGTVADGVVAGAADTNGTRIILRKSTDRATQTIV
jgi:hypothetical protein